MPWGQNPEVRLAVRGFLLVWHDVDLGLDADGAQVALVTTVVFFADITDCSHLKSPLDVRLGTIPRRCVTGDGRRPQPESKH